MKRTVKAAPIKSTRELSEKEVAAVSGGMIRPIYGPAPRR